MKYLKNTGTPRKMRRKEVVARAFLLKEVVLDGVTFEKVKFMLIVLHLLSRYGENLLIIDY